MMIVLPRSRLSACSRSRISSPLLRSRSPVGSSHSSSVGSVTIARAIATRCCWPPESSRGIVLRAVGEADDLQRGRDALAALAPAAELGEQQRQLDVLRRRSALASGCRTGRRSRCCAARQRRACPREPVDGACRRHGPPEVGRSIPPSRLSSVVFPDPDGPITATKSP